MGTTWLRWIVGASEGAGPGQRWASLVSAVHDASGLILVLLGCANRVSLIESDYALSEANVLPWDKWRTLAKKASTIIGSGQQASPLQAWLTVLESGSALALWLAPLSLEDRWLLCQPVLTKVHTCALEHDLLEAASSGTSMLATTAALCKILQCLFGFCGAFFFQALQVPTPNGSSVESMLGRALDDAAVKDVLQSPCSTLMSALLACDAVGCAQDIWSKLRTAVPADISSGEGLLPADLLGMLFVCHVMAEAGGAGASKMAGNMASSAALLRVAIADVPLPATQSLEAGFEALLSLHWPIKTPLEASLGIRMVPTRLPGILLSWGPKTSTAVSPEAWTLRSFLRTLDRL